MNLKNRLIMEEYRAQRPEFLLLAQVATQRIRDGLDAQGLNVMALSHRVKEEDSLAKKLALKGEKYATLSDITDILGIRLVCRFADEVDRVAQQVRRLFWIDPENSVDKRTLLDTNAFGYLSVHFICALPQDGPWPEALREKRFEIQVRSLLQHAWADVNHDLGYKNQFGVPRKIERGFSRLAGLLELVDEQFMQLRDAMDDYTRQIQRKIADNAADQVPVDTVSLREYVLHNQAMQALLKDIAAITGAEISTDEATGQVEQLNWLGKHTLGDLQQMLAENRQLALALAEKNLRGSELDILSAYVGLQYLCRAELLNRGYTLERAVEFLQITAVTPARAQAQAKRLFSIYAQIRGQRHE